MNWYRAVIALAILSLRLSRSERRYWPIVCRSHYWDVWYRDEFAGYIQSHQRDVRHGYILRHSKRHHRADHAADKEWASRPSDELYCIVWMDAIHYKVKEQVR